MPFFPEHIPGEKLITKVWETLAEKGVGGLLSPWQIRREGRARAEVRRYDLLMEEQARQELEQLRSGQKKLNRRGRLIEVLGRPEPEQPELPGQVALPAPPADAPALLTYALQQGAIREAERMLMLRRIAIYAEEEGEGVPDEAVSDEPLDPDWFARWRRNAEDANDELLKRLWARVLAGEVKQPKSFSFRTLDFLRNVSGEEANLIQRLAPLVAGGGFIYRNDELLKDMGFTYKIMLEIQDLGIWTGVDASGMIVRIINQSNDGSFLGAVVCHEKLLHCTADDPDTEVSVPIITLTRVGREILTLGRFSADMPYFKALGQNVKEKGLKVLLGDCEIVAQGVRMRNPVEL
jgi:hypothetical protein